MIKLKFTITGLLLAFFFQFFSTNLYGQNLSLDWAKYSGYGTTSGDLDQGVCVEVDKVGNIYTLGTFKGTLNVGPFTLTNNGDNVPDYPTFLTKQTPNGNYIWAVKLPGRPGGIVNSLSLEKRIDPITHMIKVKDGAILIGGTVHHSNSNEDFNPGPGTNTLSFPSSSNSCGYILKLDTASNFKWVKPVYSVGNSSVVSSVGIDANGNCYFTGLVRGNWDLRDTIVASNLTVNMYNQGYNSTFPNGHLFYGKLDAYGTGVWLRYSTTSYTNVYFNYHSWFPDMAVIPNGEFYISVSFASSGLRIPTSATTYWTFDKGMSPFSAMVLLRINSSGWATWSQMIGSYWYPSTSNYWYVNSTNFGTTLAYNDQTKRLVMLSSFGGYAQFTNTIPSTPGNTPIVIQAQGDSYKFSINLKTPGRGIYMVSYDVSGSYPTRQWIDNFYSATPTGITSTPPNTNFLSSGEIYAKGLAFDDLGNIYLSAYQKINKMDFSPDTISGYNGGSAIDYHHFDTVGNLVGEVGTTQTGMAKYDVNGKLKWITSPLSTTASYSSILGIAISPCNNKVYSTGFFIGKNDFDPSSSSTQYSPTSTNLGAFTWAINQDNVPNPVTITSGYNSPLCVGQSLQLNASGTGGISYNWTGPNGFTSTQQNPNISNITAAAAGDYIVTVKNAAGCSNKDTVHVGIGLFPPNAGTLTSPSVSLCSGATLNVTTNGNPGGTWQVINAGGTATINNSGVVTGGNPGFVAVKYIDTKSCGSDTASIALQVLAQPNAGILSGSFVACANTPDTISTNGDTGGAWSIDNGAGTATINNDGIVTGTSPGFVTVQYIVNNTCGADTATKNLFVMAQPNAGAISGPTSICKGDSITLTSSGDPSGAWSSSNGFGAYVNSLGVVKGVLPGSYTISYIVSNGCGADTTTYSIVVNNGANAGTINGIDTLCVGMPVTYTSNGDVGGTWTVINGTGPTGSGAASVDNNGLVTGTNAGLFTLQYTINSTCGTDAATKNVMVLAKPNAGTINGASNTVCLNSTLQLTSSGDTGGIWSATNGNCSVSSTGEVIGISQGTSTVEYIVSGICGSDTATYSITIEKLGTKKVNTYKECDGFSITVNGNTYNSTGTYTDFVGCDTIITALTIIPNPQLVLNKKDASCNENNGSAKAIGISQNPPISYDWSNNSTDSLISNLSPGVYTVIISDSMGCTTTGSTTIANIDNECGYVVSLPGAFTPNGDGKNDLLLVNGKGIKTLDFKVFNRWGNLVFQTKDPTKGWNGIYQGKEQNTAVFMYTLKVTFVNGKTVTKSGDVGLIR